MVANHAFDGWRSIEQSKNLRMSYSLDEPWRVRAACSGMAPVDGLTEPHPFYPHPGDEEGTAMAKAICATCPVREECLEFAMRTNDQYGIQGGMTAKERQALRRRRYREKAA